MSEMSRPSPSSAARSVRFALIVAGVQVVGALALTVAKHQGLIDADTTTRAVMVLIGLGLAAYGNRMPKALEGPAPQTLAQVAFRQAVTRVGGIAMTLAGLAFAALWAFAPRNIATIGSIVAVGAAMVVVFGYLAWRLRRR